MQSQVNVDSFGLDLTFYARLPDTFWTSQIHQMQTTHCSSVTSCLLSFYLHDENTMWTRRSVIHWSLSNHLKIIKISSLTLFEFKFLIFKFLILNNSEWKCNEWDYSISVSDKKEI